MPGSWLGRGLLAATVVAVGSSRAGPYDIALFNTAKSPGAEGNARLVFADSPFGVAVTADGHASYDVQIAAKGLPDPSALGAYTVYVAWAATTDLTRWDRLGVVTNGTNTVGHAQLNKFLLVVAAESSATSAHAGPTVLHGTSPSGWLQSFLSHPLFRGIPP
ncbi:MAG TPA: hypothetical protein VH277_19070 [Gemmatimonadaceae bacterium]|jgi:hypothetical protein|nr:hypothetical protein [Gemmatimonadaceae bacterium]